MSVTAPPVPFSSFGGSASTGIALARRIVQFVFRHHPTRRFAVRLWNDAEIQWGAERDFTLVFRDAATFWSLMASCDPAAFADAYVDRRLDIEGDIQAAVGLASYLRKNRPPPLLRIFAHHKHTATPRHTPTADGRDVRAHYDLSDDFFRLFLDSRMVYSCGYFAYAGQDIDEAQQRKLELVCRKLRLRPGESLLDVGCGWGALPIWAAQHHGVRVHGITLSHHQVQAARAKVAAAGLADRVIIEQRDYRTLPAGAFDKIASVGMIEHVGIRHYDAYFARLCRALRPGGLLLNHGITQPPGLAPTGGEFIIDRVFPGAEIDDLAHTLSVMEKNGLEIADVQSLRPHYALTLACWNERFVARREQAARIVSERTLRIWDLYLPGCRQAFEEGVVSVHQVLAAKPHHDGTISLPLTREEISLS
jgi:cyclopropane-fatty-acyl-phospholipid synthase